jgi:hypothetical protein
MNPEIVILQIAFCAADQPCRQFKVHIDQSQMRADKIEPALSVARICLGRMSD